MDKKYDNQLPTSTNPISELYGIQQSLVALSQHLDSQEHYGEAYTALALSRALRVATEQMDNENWQKPTTLKAV